MVRKATTMILAGPEAEDTEAEVILEEEAISAATTVVTSTASMAITPTADIVAGYGGYWGDAYASCYPYLGTPYCY
jgi:hypothetical protein